MTQPHHDHDAHGHVVHGDLSMGAMNEPMANQEMPGFQDMPMGKMTETIMTSASFAASDEMPRGLMQDGPASNGSKDGADLKQDSGEMPVGSMLTGNSAKTETKSASSNSTQVFELPGLFKIQLVPAEN